MNKSKMLWRLLLIALLVVAAPINKADAIINGLSGTNFKFTAKAGHITAGDGSSLLFWGFSDTSSTGSGVVQYPGPTLILTEGQTATITLANNLAEPVSMVFPGMTMISSASPVFNGGTNASLSSLAPEAAPTGTQTYTFKADKAGTYYYESGSNQPIQLRMGLFGAIVVRPAAYKTTSIPNVVPFGLNDKDLPANPAARHPQVRANYNDSTGIGGVAYKPSTASDLSTAYDREYLMLTSEMDPDFHKWMEFGGTYDLSKWRSNYWFFNGRNAPDTMGMPNTAVLPSQPYNTMPLIHPGERMLVRLIDMGQELHPIHQHGNHARVIAVDGNLLSSNPATSGADLAWLAFTETVSPGKTTDIIFTWSGANLGWNVYSDTARIRPYEYMADHGKTYQPNILPAQAQTALPHAATPTPQLPPQGVPVILPSIEQIIAGANYSGSPYLGLSGTLPPGEGGFNPLNGYFFMFHSHAELEITNNNTFPGGMLTMMGIIPWPDPALGKMENLDPATDTYMP